MTDLVWQKKNRVFGPEGAPAWRSAHSGMVSVVPLAGGLHRVFVTGKDGEDRFQIGWLDLDESFSVVRENPGNPVLQAGRTGCFDCNGVCMPTVIRVSGKLLYMYYVGWGLSSPGLFVNQCGLAISNDNGDTWQRWSEAPLPLLDNRDPVGVGTVFVLRETNGIWRMWYTTFREWREMPDGSWRHYYHIKYAESDDGIHWRKPEDNIAIDFADQDEYAVARPMVIKEHGLYRMWFCRRSVGSTYRIGYAESEDGSLWQRRPCGVEPSESGWDSEMVEYAYIVKRGKEYIMFYNGNGFGATGTGIAVAATDEKNIEPAVARDG